MSPRATWKGHLQIALVTIPIKVFPATESSKGIAFNQLHEPCNTRINQKTWCATCDREVPHAELVKGHEHAPGQYVLITEHEFDAVKPPSTKVIDVAHFVPVADLELRTIDRAYYLAPDGVDGGPAHYAYAVMRAALKGRAGIGKLAIYGREYFAAVAAHDQGLLLYTLHHAPELRAIDVPVINGLLAGDVALARRVIDAFPAPLDYLADFTDAYQDGLRQIIAAKVAGQEIVVPPAIATPSALPLLEALTQSLARTVTKKKPAKARLTPARQRA